VGSRLAEGAATFSYKFGVSGGGNGCGERSYHRPVGAPLFKAIGSRGLRPWLLTIGPLGLNAGSVSFSLPRGAGEGEVEGLLAAGDLDSLVVAFGVFGDVVRRQRRLAGLGLRESLGFLTSFRYLT
jgi:hypothetical protein